MHDVTTDAGVHALHERRRREERVVRHLPLPAVGVHDVATDAGVHALYERRRREERVVRLAVFDVFAAIL